MVSGKQLEGVLLSELTRRIWQVSTNDTNSNITRNIHDAALHSDTHHGQERPDTTALASQAFSPCRPTRSRAAVTTQLVQCGKGERQIVID